MPRPGRPQNKAFVSLKFTPIKQGSRYKASCNFCGKILANTSEGRLTVHRKICTANTTARREETENDEDVDEVTEPITEIVEMELLPDGTLSPLPSTSASTSTISEDITDNDSASTFRPTKLKRRNTGLMSFIDKLDKKEEEDITSALADFFFGCNIPLLTIESTHLKNLIKKLRPSYVDKIPGRKQLSTTILNNTYEKCITKARNTLNPESVLLVDGWKNCSNNSKTVVTMVHTSDGKQAFLDAFDVTTESETAEKLSEIVNKSVQLAKELYDTNIYAVVSDNASPMIKMGKLMKHVLWHTTCNSHTGNLLAKDVTDKKLIENISTVLKEFKHPDLEKLIINQGGSRIKLPAETRWCSYRDSNQCLLSNLKHMKLIAADESKKIKQKVSQLLFNNDFLEEVKESIEVYNPICELINLCQSSDFSIADAANLWLDLQLPERYKSYLEERKKMAMNDLSIVAFFLHPHYDHKKLDLDHKKKLNLFLLKILNGKGLEECDNFNSKSDIFEVLYEKDIKNPLVFWRMAEVHCPNLAKLAIRILSIPASSAQLERVFSTWAIIHTPLRNRLTFERSKKLMHVYYTLRMSDTIPRDEDEAGDI